MQPDHVSVGTLLQKIERQPGRWRTTAYAAIPLSTLLLALLLGAISQGGTARAPTVVSPDRVLPGSGMTAVEIFSNNARLMGAILVGGILTLSLGTFFLYIINGVYVGSGIAFLVSSYGPMTAIAAVAPHGLFELAAYVVAGSVAFRLSVLFMASGEDGSLRGKVSRAVILESLMLVALALALLAIAAVIEATVTPAIVTMIGSPL